jgi:hypothetical protein
MLTIPNVMTPFQIERGIRLLAAAYGRSTTARRYLRQTFTRLERFSVQERLI